MSSQNIQKGQLEPVEFGGKVIAVKRKCSCGGDVTIEKDPQTKGNVATCKLCGATLRWGGTTEQKS